MVNGLVPFVRRAMVELMTLAESPLHSPANLGLIRTDWTRAEIRALFALPFPELMFEARAHPPDAFRSGRGADLDAAVDQDRRLPGGLRLLPAERALRHRRRCRKADERSTRCSAEARAAKAAGASRFCMGAAWRSPKDRDVENVCAMVEGVKALGLETCATLGMLTRRAGAAAQGSRPRLLQPQPRHLAGILRRDHHHAHLPGSARHARRTCATPASTSAAAASSAWARAPRTAPA